MSLIKVGEFEIKSKDDLTRESVLKIAYSDTILYAAIHQWEKGNLSWEEALIYAVLVMNGRMKQMEQLLFEKRNAEMPTIQASLTKEQFAEFMKTHGGKQ